MPKIAITAASGQLGAAIARATAQVVGSDDVVALARTPTKIELTGIEARPGDYGDREQLTAALAGVDAVLLVSLAGDPALRVDLHRNVIHAAKAAGVKRLVYTSVQGAEEGTAFSPIVQSNRQTEADVRDSGLEFVIGRNGIYIEPDVEYVDRYKAAGEIANCAGDGRCGYTTRPELAYAYARLLTSDGHHGQTYNLNGRPLAQAELAAQLNRTFGLELRYRSMTVEEYRRDRVDELGDFMGSVIAGIYEGIRDGAVDNESHFERAAGRPHQAWDAYFDALRAPSAD